MPTPEAEAVGRILVLLERSAAGRATLEAAVQLASRRQRELCGLFVEDLDLLRSAALPFAAEVRATSGATRPLRAEQLERLLNLHTRELRRWLQRAAGPRALPWSLQVARGRLTAEVAAACRPDDLLVLGRPPPRAGYRFAGVAPVERIATQACCAVAIVSGSRAAAGPHPVVAVADGEPGRRAVAAAAALARDTGQRLVVLARPGEPDPAAAAPGARVRRLPGLDPPQLLAALRLERGHTLVVSRASLPATGEWLRTLDELVLLVP